MKKSILLIILLLSCSEKSEIPDIIDIEKQNQDESISIQEKSEVLKPEIEPIIIKKNKVKYINLSWPAKGTISSGYGKRQGRTHHGIDITKDNGKNINAAASGIIEFSDRNGSLGNTIIINHGNGIKTIYAHCSKLFAMKNSKVRKGQLIAMMGSTGNTSGVHLHFEIRIDGESQNPLKYLPVR